MTQKEDPVVSEVLQNGGSRGRLGPVLVNFEHGSVNPEAFERFEPELKWSFDEGSVGKAPSIDLRIKAGGMFYSNKVPSVQGSQRPNPYQRTFLAVRNKRTNLVRLVEMSTVCVGAEVTPPPPTNSILVKEALKNEASLVDEKCPEEAKKKRMAMNKHVVGEFGQAKGKKIYEQAGRMQVEAEKLSHKLSRAAMAVSEDAIAMPAAMLNSQSVDLCPPCNRNATSVQEVYRLQPDILTSSEVEVLEQAANELLEEYESADRIEDAVQIKKFSPMFGKLLLKGLKTGKTRGCAASLYLEGIVRFLSMRPAAFSKGARALPDFVPLSIRQKVFREFTSSQGTASPESRDRAVCHAIVLGLLTNDYSFEFSDLTSSIRGVKGDQLKKLVKVAGATLRTDAPTKTSYVVLKLPLSTFDTAGSLRRKSGRR